MTTREHFPLTLGFMPLLDCAPLIVAERCGFFAQHGLDVSLQRQNSWATLRDKLHAGMLHAAHLLAPMPIASALGLGCAAQHIQIPQVLSYHGNGITLSNTLTEVAEVPAKQQAAMFPEADEVLLQRWLDALGRNLRLATVFPYSNHYYQLRDWLPASATHSVDIHIVPPAQLVSLLQSGDIDGFCVGGPWNAVAVRLGLGSTVCTSTDLWPNIPEKVLGVQRHWAQQHPQQAAALRKALCEACAWLTSVPNRFEAARWLTDAHIIDQPLEAVAPGLIGSCLVTEQSEPRTLPDYYRFQDALAGNIPDRQHLTFIHRKMQLAGHCAAPQSDAFLDTLLMD